MSLANYHQRDYYPIDGKRRLISLAVPDLVLNLFCWIIRSVKCWLSCVGDSKDSASNSNCSRSVPVLNIHAAQRVRESILHLSLYWVPSRPAIKLLSNGNVCEGYTMEFRSIPGFVSCSKLLGLSPRDGGTVDPQSLPKWMVYTGYFWFFKTNAW